MTTVVKDTTTHNRTRVLMGAPLIEAPGGQLYQPTALAYSWDSNSQPRYVDVLARKLKKDGTPGASARRLMYRMPANTNEGYRLAPAWVAALVVTK